MINIFFIFCLFFIIGWNNSQAGSAFPTPTKKPHTQFQLATGNTKTHVIYDSSGTSRLYLFNSLFEVSYGGLCNDLWLGLLLLSCVGMSDGFLYGSRLVFSVGSLIELFDSP